MESQNSRAILYLEIGSAQNTLLQCPDSFSSSFSIKDGTEKRSMSKLQKAQNKGAFTRGLIHIVSLTSISATKANRSVNIVLRPINYACISM